MAEIRHLMNIDAPPGRVYEAVATREGVAGWWTPRIDGGDEVGETMRMHFDGVGTSTDMKVVTLTPSRRVEWQSTAGDFEGTTARFDLIERGEGTFLRFTQSGWPEASEHFAGWGARP